MTVCERILARAASLPSVTGGDIIDASVDRAMIHDNNAPLVMQQFSLIRGKAVWDPDRVHFFVDHHTPSSNHKAAQHHARMREFAKANGIRSFYDCGAGICHTVMLEDGHAGKGLLIAGTDSHTTGEGAAGAFAIGIGATEMAAVLATGKVWLVVPRTIKIVINGTFRPGVGVRDAATHILKDFGTEGADYCCVEFSGPAVDAMDLSEKAVLCVMSAEMGAKAALVAASGEASTSADCLIERKYDISSLSPLVACPSLPTNAVPVEEVAGMRIKINQAAIASCAGASIKDLEIAARILSGRTIPSGVRLIVSPSSRRVFSGALAAGYLKTLHDAGAIISSPGCGVCGAHDIGALAPGEVCISSTTRNMPGRMGSGGEIYLAGAATVAASAAAGVISDPREYVR